MTFQRERAGFHTFKHCFEQDSALREELKRAIGALYERYDTTIRENRFVVGGALEIILGAALRACGLPVRHRGTETVEWDLLFEDGEGGYSIKSLPKSPSTRLVNVLSRSVSPELWRVATLFVLREGLVYADPDLPWWQSRRNDANILIPRSDALEIKRKTIRAFAEANPAWFLPWDVFEALGAPRSRRQVRTASYDVATAILKDETSTLFRYLPHII